MGHADSEHRPRPPGGERSRFVSRSKSAALAAVAVITLVCSIATRCWSAGDPEDDMHHRRAMMHAGLLK
ncbi:hypothetical protein EYC54_20575 [Xanthomonas oryzae]|nr:hypothetical protein EYC54_20575 [Xanthomonas oryzae]